METSTPRPGVTNDLRRRTLLKNAAQMSPLRKSLNVSPNSSLLEESNDDEERSDRRHQQDIHKRLSNLSTRSSPLNETFIKEQFIICTHLFTENKINSKNAWKLQIIDLLKPLCQKSSKDSLQVASTSIDISAKVYGIRVDDIHSEGFKLANSMARAAEKMPAADDDEEGAENEGAEDAENIQKKKKKKKRVNLSGKKMTVSDSSKPHCGPLPKLEPIEFTTRVNADTGTMENLYTNTFKECCTSFLLLDKIKAMFDERDTTVQNKENIPFDSLPQLPERVTKINHPFSDFRLDEWDPDNEEKQLGVEKSILSQLQPVVFDDDGIPIPELDGSIHDIFENNDADVDADLNDEDDDIRSIHEMGGAPQPREGEIARIVDFRSVNDDNGQTSEYSYNSIVNSRTGKFIDQIWAGPHHWKLKFLRRSAARFSGQQRSVTSTKEHRQGRKRNEPEMVDLTKKVEIDLSKKLVVKKKPTSVDFNKITLPLLDQTCARMLANTKELMLKPGVCPLEKKQQTNDGPDQLDYEVTPYKYENPNDSQYCAQSHEDDNGAMDGPLEDGVGSDNEVEEHINREQPHNMAENLVDNPEMVPKSYVAYAMKAKQMDMKKLKTAVWHFLTSSTSVPNIAESEQRKVNSTTFSKMYSNLPKLLPEKELNELSCHLAFVALLHLCNEKNLALEQVPTYKDFEIYGPK